jgi:hypothetical protein
MGKFTGSPTAGPDWHRECPFWPLRSDVHPEMAYAYTLIRCTKCGFSVFNYEEMMRHLAMSHSGQATTVLHYPPALGLEAAGYDY